MKTQDLYDMKLHDMTFDNDKGIGILRVVGGWIYWALDNGDSGVFVPDQAHIDTSLYKRFI